jgi:hypothetical protein
VPSFSKSGNKLLNLIPVRDPSVSSHQAGGDFMAEKRHQQQDTEQTNRQSNTILCFPCFQRFTRI